ncbi:VOC family protein [Streptomyces albireticuli]|nr:VOC family protein [Streptomyces albireticuli]MCD9145542.1 VOC family protein [Streptomyces albireticuli]MCD9165168.1 VOC family protein [Streptomyces albireticuli]MCD9195697.1 VOC family protein [Streptomyces albireticuli]
MTMTEVWGSPQSSTGEARHTPGTPCWTSLLAHDLESIKDFYSGLFGWAYYSPGPRQLGPYVRATLDGRDVAGLGELTPGRRLPTAWTTYLASDDADEAAEWIRCCGGTVGVGPLAAEDAGRLVIASDPAGAPFGVWQGQRMAGAQLSGVPGTPVWHELMTRRTDTVVKFYQSLFGYQTKRAEAPDTDRLALHLDGRPVAAVRGVGAELPRERGPHWMTYFEVADAGVAAARVAGLGGRVLRPPHQGPDGDETTVADPEGAVLTLRRTAR